MSNVENHSIFEQVVHKSDLERCLTYLLNERSRYEIANIVLTDKGIVVLNYSDKSGRPVLESPINFGNRVASTQLEESVTPEYLSHEIKALSCLSAYRNREERVIHNYECTHDLKEDDTIVPSYHVKIHRYIDCPTFRLPQIVVSPHVSYYSK